ncbi:hypothetical protein SLEP1_g8827 [Rubroshorea leprosula]|uniref:Cytochrome P450 n=1 Tax=Rubroshorea leprosula TaxID=152421 RepID=A0AAV5IDW8_9ROSI|nr:hypothetical protein SLEP1_g8827 [Rubroshorea leprosula]
MASQDAEQREGSLTPRARGLPLLGYLPFLGPNLHHMFKELARIYGSTYKLSIGRKIYVVISSPSLVKEMVRDQDTSIFVREMLCSENLDAFYSNRRNEMKKIISYVYGKIGKKANIGELAFTKVINMVSSMFWGGTFEEEKGRHVNA